MESQTESETESETPQEPQPQESPKPRRPRRQKAVIDRVEEGAWAVLLVGREEIEKIVHVDHLPEGARAGTWLKVRIEDDTVRDILVDAAETQAAKARVSSKLDMLRKRKPHFKPVSATQLDDDDSPLANPAPPTAPDDAPKLLTGPVGDAADESPDRTRGAADLTGGALADEGE